MIHNISLDFANWRGASLGLVLLKHIDWLLASNRHKLPSQHLRVSTHGALRMILFFFFPGSTEEQKMPSEELSCRLPKDLLDAFSVANRTLRELLLSELQKSSLIRPLNR